MLFWEEIQINKYLKDWQLDFSEPVLWFLAVWLPTDQMETAGQLHQKYQHRKWKTNPHKVMLLTVEFKTLSGKIATFLLKKKLFCLKIL